MTRRPSLAHHLLPAPVPRTAALLAPVSKTWRDAVTAAPRTIASLITAPFAIPRSPRGRRNDSLRRGPRFGGSAALVRRGRQAVLQPWLRLATDRATDRTQAPGGGRHAEPPHPDLRPGGPAAAVQLAVLGRGRPAQARPLQLPGGARPRRREPVRGRRHGPATAAPPGGPRTGRRRGQPRLPGGQMFGAGGLALAAGCIFVADNSNRRGRVGHRTAPLARRRGRAREISYPVDVAVPSAPLHPAPPPPTPACPLPRPPPSPRPLHPRPRPHQVHGLELFVADAENHRVVVFGGWHLPPRLWRRGHRPGQFGWLSGVAVGQCSRLFVAEHAAASAHARRPAAPGPPSARRGRARANPSDREPRLVVDETTHHVHVLSLDGCGPDRA